MKTSPLQGYILCRGLAWLRAVTHGSSGHLKQIMGVNPKWAVIACASAMLCGVAGTAGAQVDLRDLPIVSQPQQRFNSGQDVQPIFEGWTRNTDGSYQVHFGYLNRNYQEQPSIPVGPNNFFSPGHEDRHQPTYFYPRTQRYQFSVRAQADWGQTDELVWSLTVNGSTQYASAWLQQEWEIDANTFTSNTGMGRGRSRAEVYADVPPVVTVGVAQASVAVEEPLTLTASITDDELPGKVPSRRPRRQRHPSLIEPDGSPKVPDNIQWYRKPRPPRNGLAILWIVYRGPSDATFTPPGFQRSVSEEEGDDAFSGVATSGPLSSESTSLEGDGWTSATFETTVTFDTPGTYTLRAFESDAMLLTPADVTVAVTERSGQ